MKSQEFLIDGPPVPWTAPRITKYGHYSTKRKAKESAIIQILSQTPKLMVGPLYIEAVFIMPIPKSLSKKKKEKIVDSWHIKKADLTNLEKFLLDVLQLARVYKNDSQICAMNLKKIYGFQPKTEIIIREII